MDKRYNYSKQNHCVDCDILISNRATRCYSCTGKKRGLDNPNRWPTYIVCDYCKKKFKQRYYKNKTGLYFCCLECKNEYHKIECDWCGKRFKPDHPKRAKIHACSYACSGKLRSNQILVVCDNCGEKVYKPPSLAPKGHNHFCSMKCKHEWFRGKNHTSYNSVDCICEICGTEFTREKSKVDKNGGKYCSQPCFSQSQVLPAQSYYGPNWLSQRKEARKRDNDTCQYCGTKQTERKLDVHHIIPFRVFELVRYKEANNLSNLISLCMSCHRRVEKGSVTL